MNEFAELASALGESLSANDLKLKLFIRGPEEADILPGSVSISVNRQAGTASVEQTYESGIHEKLSVELRPGETVWHRTVQNRSGKVFRLRELGCSIAGLHFGGRPRDDYFYHVENPRIYNRLCLAVDARRDAAQAAESSWDSVAGNKWADPGVVTERIGASPYQPFPAILLSNMKKKNGIVHGTLSQQVFYHNYLVSHTSDRRISLEIFSSCKAISALEFKPGDTLSDHWYLGTTGRAADYEQIFSGYLDVLRRHLPPLYGATDINRRTVVWGSWNDGIFRDIDEKRILENAEYLRRNFPTVGWVQIDDGYATLSGALNIAHGLGAPYEKNHGVDERKFPEGLAKCADRIRALGLRPALWIGGFVPKETPIYREHPEWFFDYSYRVAKSAPLDVSRKEVREYMKSAIDFYLLECGFEGVKQDFWSYAFEDRHDMLANKERTGHQWRGWWLGEIRKRLPSNGYLQTGCDIVMGNPFLAEHFTNYRYGIDIGAGHWDEVATTFLWGAACFALHIGDLFVPNSDSVGLYPGLTDDEALFCINYCLISRSMVELSGWLYQQPGHPRFKRLKKALCCPNNGQDVHFAQYDYRAPANRPPSLWYLKTPHFSRLDGGEALPLRTIACFNLEDKTVKFTLKPRQFGLRGRSFLITDVWTESTCEWKGSFEIEVPPHGSRLLSVSQATARPQLLDANIEVSSVSQSGKRLVLELAHGGDLVLRLSRRPLKADFEGGAIAPAMDSGEGNWRFAANLPGPGTLALLFE